MKLKYLATAAVAFAAMAATPAMAQDASQDAGQPASQDAGQVASQGATGTDLPFNGLYVGVSGGYDVQSNDVGSAIGFDRNGDGNFHDAVPTSTGGDAFSTGYCNGRARDASRLPTGCEKDRNRASYYGRVGVDRQYGPFVFGLIGEFGRTEIKDYTSAFSTAPQSYVFSRGIDWEASGGVRAGFAADTTLFYGKGEFGYARLTHGFTTTNTQNSFTTLVNDRDRKGFVVGGGIEHRFMRHLSIGLEYSYHDYKDRDFKVLATRGNAPATSPFVLAPYTSGTVLTRLDDNFRWHSLRATLGYHF